MNQTATILLGAVAGLTIFIGLPVARLGMLAKRVQGFLNAVALGVILFLLWDVLSQAGEPVSAALKAARSGDQAPGSFPILLATFAGGLTIGLLGLVAINGLIMKRIDRARARLKEGPGAALARGVFPIGAGQTIALSIALGLGLHNFSEGLAIGQSAVSGAISLAVVLIVGFALHNITEGFGIAAPTLVDPTPPPWPFLGITGLIAGGPTFLGTVIGTSFTSVYVFVLCLALAGGALFYVINELFGVSRRLNTPGMLALGILLGFGIGYGTDLVLIFQGL